MKGTPFQLSCTASDPRSAARSKPKHSNMLEIGNSHKSSTDQDDEDLEGEPLEYDLYYDTNDRDFSQNSEGVDYSSDFLELADDDEEDIVPKRRGNRKKQRGKELNNRKLERKQLESRKRKLRPKPEIRDDEDYEDGNYRKELAPVTYTWFHNGTEIRNESRRYMYADGTLFFKKFGSHKPQKSGLQDTGEYRCVAHGSSGSTLSHVVNLNYAFMNRDFSRYPVDTEVFEGDSVQLSCNIKSNPPAKITWMKESMVLAPNKRIYHLSPTSLLITNVNLEDSGKYRCIARNFIVNKTKPSPEGIVTVMKQQQSVYPISFVYDEFESVNDTVLQHVKNVTAYYGDNVFLSCAVNGKPKPKVVWSYQADGSNVTTREISSMEIHKIPKITEESSGVYTCVANNPHQSIKQVYHVDVLRAPYLRQIPTSEHTPTAKTVRFNCSAGGSPPPTLLWFRNGQLLNITGRVKLKSLVNKTPELIISDTVSSDKGIYQCMAINGVGEASAWASLSVQTQNVPPPYNVECKPIGADAIRISWSPPKASIVAYTVHYVLADGGEEHSQIRNPDEYDLKKLELYRKYDIYVKAYNTNGASDQSEHIICHGQGVKIYLSSLAANNSIHISWKDQSSIVKSWMVQWRMFGKSGDVINNVTLPGSADSYVVPDAFPVEKYEYRVLASPSEQWIAQNLELIPWTSSKNRLIIPYKETFSLRNQSHLDEFDAGNPRVQDPDITEREKLDYPRPTNVVATAIGPHSINVSWLCDAAESSSDAYFFEVCYSQSDHTINEMRIITLEKKNETCQSSFNTWSILRGLETGTYYAIKIQAIMQNKLVGGPFSEIVFCRTARSEKSSISDVQWKKVSENVIKISWNHILSSNALEDDGGIVELSEVYIENHQSAKRSWTYIVRYTQDLSSPITSWPSKNVTDDNSVEIYNLNPEKDCFIMVFVAGENIGSPLDISAKDLQKAPVTVTAVESDHQLGILLGLLLLLVCIVILGAVLFWHRRKVRREQHRQICVQMRTRAGKSDFECQELMYPPLPPCVDSKGGVIYINGIDSDGTMSSEVGVPLLSGHIRITENPRFLPKKHMGNGNCRPLLGKKSLGPVFDGTFDVSRYEELPDVTIETVLEGDVSDHVGSEATSHSTLPMGRKQCAVDVSDVENNDFDESVVNNINLDAVNGTTNYTIDRNSHSELTNVKSHNESIGNEIAISENNKSYLNENNVGANANANKPLIESNKQHVTIDRISLDKTNINCIAENVKNKCGVDALTGYRENGGSRRIAPVIGPNG